MQNKLTTLCLALLTMSGGEAMAQRGLFWLTVRTRIRFYKRPAMMQTVELETWPGTVEGMRSVSDNAFSVQYHPESAPGPEDSGYLFDEFVNMLKRAGR